MTIRFNFLSMAFAAVVSLFALASSSCQGTQCSCDTPTEQRVFAESNTSCLVGSTSGVTLVGSSNPSCNGITVAADVFLNNDGQHSSTSGLEIAVQSGALECDPEMISLPFYAVDETLSNLPTDDSTTYFTSGYGDLELRYLADHQGANWPAGLQEGFASVAIVIRMATGETLDLGIVDLNPWCNDSCYSGCGTD